jgi:mannosyl-3-phosphoglycerate phosphatase family protein
MKKVPEIVVFCDVDGLLLDPHTQAFAEAGRILEPLVRDHTPFVLCSGKTRAELEVLHQALGLSQPFICEHGGAAMIPSDYFDFDLPYSLPAAGYRMISCGRPYSAVVDTLHRTAERVDVEIAGFSDMSVEEVARDFRVPLLQARLAKLREYEEPFRVVDDRASSRDRLFRALRSAGLRCITGRRYHYAGAPVDRRFGIKLLRNAYQRAYGAVVAVGFADASTNDELLSLVDYPVTVHDGEGEKSGATMRDWATAIVEIVDELRRSSGPRMYM